MAMLENLIRIDNENNQIYEQIQIFLRKKEKSSKNTAKNYGIGIRDFFRIIKKKDLKYLTIDDIQITLDDFDHFILEGIDKGWSNATINQKIVAMVKLLKMFYVKGYVEDIKYIETGEIERLKDDSIEYGVLTVDEVLKMAQLALKTEREKREIKYYLILFALDTMYRKSAILNLKWNDFEEKDDFVHIKVIDKGNKKYRRQISKEFYQELLSLKKEGIEKVFNISSGRIDDMMDRLKEKMNIPEQRNIVFHSIRKAGVTFVYNATGDILEAMKAANHKRVNTTQIYIGTQDYGAIGAISSSMNMDIDLYKKVSHEELLQAISQMDNSHKILLSRKLQENIKGN